MRRPVLLATLGLALLLPPGAQAQTSLGEVYRLVRGVYCAWLAANALQNGGAPGNCPLPAEIVMPADDGIVKRTLEVQRDVLLVGGVPREDVIRQVLANRVRSGPPGQAVWVLLSPNPSIEAWAESLVPKDGSRPPFTVDVVLVEPSDLAGSISRIPFVIAGTNLFFPLLDTGAWAQPVGSVADTVVGALRTVLNYATSQAKARKAMKSREALP